MQQMIETSLEELSKSQTLNHTQQLLLSDLNLAGVKYRSQVVLNQSLDLFWNMQNESFDPNLRLSVYYGAIADGDRDEYFAVRSLYLSTSDAIEKTRLVFFVVVVVLLLCWAVVLLCWMCVVLYAALCCMLQCH